nr:MAG TPA: hypothetical protein [Caudoviricetes sp.]
MTSYYIYIIIITVSMFLNRFTYITLSFIK